MAWRYFDDEDLARVKQVLDSGNLCAIPGIQVPEFEKRFAEEFSSPLALAGTNAMAMMHAAVSVSGAEPGDEIIVDPLVCFAAISVMYHNAIPVYCDVRRDTHNLDPSLLEGLITDRTRAIWVTHLWGLPADMDEINAVAEKHGLMVFEDCAHAIYATYKGRYAGTLGDVGTFSFQQSKQLGLGDGGMALMKSEDVRTRMYQLCHFGTVPDVIGWNYRMNELVAAVGITQLGRARGYVDRCVENAEILGGAIADFDWIVPQHVEADRTHAWHIWCPVFEGDKVGIDYGEFQAACQELELPIAFGYIQKPAYLQDCLSIPLGYGKGCPVYCPHASREMDYSEGLCPVAEDLMPRFLLMGTGGETDDFRALADRLHQAASRFA